MSNDFYRHLVLEKLILPSIKDGKLDLALLRELTNQYAKNLTDAEKLNAGEYGVAKAGYMESLTLATHQVLGLVPESSWADDDTRDVFTKALHAVARGVGVVKPETSLAEFQEAHGLIASKGPKKHNPDKPLAEQGYEFTISPKRKQQEKDYKTVVQLNEAAGALLGAVTAALDKNSVQGAVIHAVELEVIEDKMQGFIERAAKNPLLITPEARVQIVTSLEKLRPSGMLDTAPLKDKAAALEAVISPSSRASYELQGLVKAARASDSKGGVAIHEDELDAIKDKLQEVASSYKQTKKATDGSRTALEEALSALKASGVASEIKDELGALQKQLPKAAAGKQIVQR